MRVEMQPGTMERSMWSDFLKIRQEFHHRGDGEDIHAFVKALEDTGMEFVKKYRNDPDLHRMAGMLMVIQLLDAREKDIGDGAEFIIRAGRRKGAKA